MRVWAMACTRWRWLHLPWLHLPWLHAYHGLHEEAVLLALTLALCSSRATCIPLHAYHGLHEEAVLLRVVDVRDGVARAAREQPVLLGVGRGEEARAEEDVVEDVVVALAWYRKWEVGSEKWEVGSRK